MSKVEEYAKLMEELHKKARKEGREFGFIFCEKEGKLFPSMTTEGGECAIEKIIDCEIFGAKAKGSFHTHPSDIGISLPAVEDVCYAVKQNHDFLCLSGEIPRRVACWKIVDIERLKGNCAELGKAKNPKEATDKRLEIMNTMEKHLKEFYAKPVQEQS